MPVQPEDAGLFDVLQNFRQYIAAITLQNVNLRIRKETISCPCAKLLTEFDRIYQLEVRSLCTDHITEVRSRFDKYPVTRLALIVPDRPLLNNVRRRHWTPLQSPVLDMPHM